MNPPRWLSALFFALAVVAGASLWLQRQAAEALRDEIVLLREEHAELARLRAERERLRAAQPPAAELDRLRADRAAVVRLRAELDALKASVQRQERALAEPAPRVVKGAEPVPPAVPALRLEATVGPDGSLTLDGAPVELGMMKLRLAALPKGELIEIRLLVPKAEGSARAEEAKQNFRQTFDTLQRMAKELGLRLAVQLADAPRG